MLFPICTRYFPLASPMFLPNERKAMERLFGTRFKRLKKEEHPAGPRTQAVILPAALSLVLADTLMGHGLLVILWSLDHGIVITDRILCILHVKRRGRFVRFPSR
jgi:hypothetical protein